MTHEQLKAFTAVVQAGSFRAAAVQIFKAQSTLSSAVKSLEQEFSITLFDRNSYRPSLTPAGKAFYQQARKLLGSTAELERLGHQLAKGTPPTLSLSLSSMCVYPQYLNAFKDFSSQHPELKLELGTHHLSGVLEQLHKDKAELAIGPNHGLDNRYEFAEISQIKIQCVAAPGFLKLAENEIVSHEQLRRKPHILISDSGTDTPFDYVNVIPGGRQWLVNDYSAKRSLLIAGLGWARMPLHMIEDDLTNARLVPLQVENFASKTQLPIYLIRLKDKTLSKLATELWKAIINNE